ncbi:MAG: hypothetical protein INR81_02595 [Microcystis aeruginosa PMC 728.11]|nr:hypothetical protein [Microcystis aeruginosa PMC 728.11]
MLLPWVAIPTANKLAMLNTVSKNSPMATYFNNGKNRITEMRSNRP